MGDLVVSSDSVSFMDVIAEVKESVYACQRRAVLSVNSELVLLYWNIGRVIVEKSEWGSGFIKTLSKELMKDFPEIKGFSERNLKYMKKFATCFKKKQIVQTLSAQLSWSHTVLVLDKVSSQVQREWYLVLAAREGWSVRVLEHQIDLNLYSRRKAGIVSNFDAVIPERSEAVKEIFKDKYVFDFLCLGEKFSERQLEESLVNEVVKMLMEFGNGFAFVGRQVHLEVGGDDFYIDLLFYHLKLHCYVVVDLKSGKFTPEFAGKMNFYLSAVDELIKSDEDKRSIGLILCKDKRGLVAEYALRDLNKPLGVSEYVLASDLPDELKRVLPGADDFGAGVLREMEVVYRRMENE